MPELPEVEVTRRSLAQAIEGATTQGARLGQPLRWPLGCEPAELAGRRVGAVLRRGKYLWLPLGPRPGRDEGDAGGLLLHLGMSGSLGFTQAAPDPGKHDHFDLLTTRGLLRLHDPRRFGAVLWSPAMDQEPARSLLSRLGPEPFDPALDPGAFHRSLQGRRQAIKPLLLAGDIVVGAGNIYACEALYRAGIHPDLSAARISRPRAARLLEAVRNTLAQALALGGSTLRDFRDAHGMDGAYQTQAAVYGREGEACTHCGTTIRRIVQGQRSTYFCPRCQRR
ncbi:MAG: bifunctional DNA-formamidopyrimidine glycosylase/DNA-(apurinic or apyrimidinic site) lyase [Rubrivivax sp.]|nr:bifunctional DNA-formamidopyrimidine glycosylase/DNA-(apurinic or apyrimidinic site) lyase [Rubrivivax sp.]